MSRCACTVYVHVSTTPSLSLLLQVATDIGHGSCTLPGTVYRLSSALSALSSRVVGRPWAPEKELPQGDGCTGAMVDVLLPTTPNLGCCCGI